MIDTSMKQLVICFLLTVVTSSLAQIHDTLSNCRPVLKRTKCTGFNSRQSFRTVDGSCNNLKQPTQGAANTPLKRLLGADYVDLLNLDTPRGFPGTKPVVSTPHEVAGAVFSAHIENVQRARGLSSMFMAFGQFVDHDVGLTLHPSCDVSAGCGSSSAFKYPCFPIKFTNSGSSCTAFARSIPVCQTTKQRTVREQINILSSYLDASQVYSNDKTIFKSLRTLDGTGQMKVTTDQLLPISVPGSSPSCNNPAGCSLVGDERGDENIVLHSVHTLFVRNHNLLAKGLQQRNRRWSGNTIFETARKINIAIIQHIIYSEFVPELTTLKRYSTYDRKTDAGVLNVFSTAVFRFGHSLIPNAWAMLDKNFNKAFEPVSLQASFFNTAPVRQHGIEPVMFGLLQNQSQLVDTRFAFGIARRLFVPVGEITHEDLTALNIQRGRDHGLPTYGAWRKECKLKTLISWKDLIGVMPASVIKGLKKIYKHPNDIDLFAAGIAEKHVGGKVLGATFQCILKTQFERLRNGDRLYYERNRVFTKAQRSEIRKMSLAKVLCDNLKGVVSMQSKAFQAFTPGTKRRECSSIPGLNLDLWA